MHTVYELMAFLGSKRSGAEVILRNTATNADLKIDGLDEDNETGQIVIEVHVTEYEKDED